MGNIHLRSYGPRATVPSRGIPWTISHVRAKPPGFEPNHPEHVSCIEMRIGRLYHRFVGYLMELVWDPATSTYFSDPVGTVFFVEYGLDDGRGVVRYAITCRHVIEGLIRNNCDHGFLRVNDPHGQGLDFPTNPREWVLSERADVAAIRFDLPAEETYWAYPIERTPEGIMDAQTVFFIGMFALVPGATSVQAIVRTGTIARHSSSIPLCFQADPKESIESIVHLIEMRSWGGESGSPVFVYDERSPEDQYYTDPGYLGRHQARPHLLGMLHGQLEVEKTVSQGGQPIGTSRANSWIGVVIPIGDIQTLLREADVFVVERSSAGGTGSS